MTPDELEDLLTVCVNVVNQFDKANTATIMVLPQRIANSINELREYLVAHGHSPDNKIDPNGNEYYS